MFIILGSGINGLLLAQRARLLKKPFVIIGEGLLKSNNRKGFFYSHTENPFIDPSNKFPVRSVAHEGGTPDKYAKKVYGFQPHSRISYEKYARAKPEVIGEGWLYDVDKLLEGIEPGNNYFEDRVVRIGSKAIHTLKGRTWPTSFGILNTVPLPTILKLMKDDTSYLDDYEEYLESKPIYVQEQNIRASWLEFGIGVEYCANDCHPWYRQSGISHGVGAPMTVYQEFSEPPQGDDYFTLKPGKIWYRDEIHQKYIQTLVEDLNKFDWIHCFGRYGKWSPKLLSSDVWEDSKAMNFLYHE